MDKKKILFETDAPYRVSEENYFSIVEENLSKLADIVGINKDELIVYKHAPRFVSGGQSTQMIIDGEVIDNTLKSLGRDGEWLNVVLKEKRVDAGDVFLLTVSDSGEINLIKKDGCKK